MYWQKDIETMDRKALRKLQAEKLAALVSRVYGNVPLYRQRFDARGIKPDQIKTLEDLKNVPFTVKSDMRDNYPFGLLAVPRNKIVRIHASSGTTGKPTVVGYTREDMDMWSDVVARFCMAAGVTEDDTAQIAFGYGLFTGALGLHQGLEKIGAAVIPMSSGNTEKQLMLMEDFGTTALIATPSYAMYLSEAAKEAGVVSRLKLRVGLFGAEGCSPEMRERIEKNFGIIATDNYGMSELIGPGVSGECLERCGMHIAEDHFYAEIIDPKTGEVLPEGETGELVVTTLSKQALPLLRYRTGDITRLNPEPCKCGRTHARMDKIKGRSDDMLVIKGINVFPTQIESVLMGMADVGSHYQLIVRREGLRDTLQVNIELVDAAMLERYSELENLQHRIHDRLKSVLGLETKVTLVSPNSIERFQGKAKRVVDQRNA